MAVAASESAISCHRSRCGSIGRMPATYADKRMEPLLRRREVAELLGVSVRTVNRLAERGELDVVRIGRGARFQLTTCGRWSSAPARSGVRGETRRPDFRGPAPITDPNGTKPCSCRPRGGSRERPRLAVEHDPVRLAAETNERGSESALQLGFVCYYITSIATILQVSHEDPDDALRPFSTIHSMWRRVETRSGTTLGIGLND